VTYGKSFTNGVRLVLSGTLYESAGADRLFYRQFNTTNQNNGVARDLDDDSFRSFFWLPGLSGLYFANCVHQSREGKSHRPIQ